MNLDCPCQALTSLVYDEIKAGRDATEEVSHVTVALSKFDYFH